MPPSAKYDAPLSPDRDIRVDGTVALKQGKFADDQANFDGSRIVARGRFGGMAAGLADRSLPPLNSSDV